MRIFVLLFNVGTDNEGIHSLKIEDRDVVLMFEDEDDATRFGLMLEAQDFPSPTVEGMEEEEIKEFCASVGYEARLIEQGQLELPPENTVEDMDWQEEGSKSVDLSQPPSNRSDAEPNDDGEFSDDELDRIRRQLEGLL
ncbi:DUF3110 domain-containing protein [Okeania sp. SIO2G5]|uniref:DUF3110 domain-containing protein n=1 Tax=Okeania sp. SIO2G5 TaxID=2607796 RepID=UPI0013C237C4|nr:DUF3110 domain-containing protein [Okeania sp. SIO2G5]NEP76459.1 DUF3110 domain-containing protein [Okeania sp. SIO2G5]